MWQAQSADDVILEQYPNSSAGRATVECNDSVVEKKYLSKELQCTVEDFLCQEEGPWAFLGCFDEPKGKFLLVHRWAECAEKQEQW
jgi:hypothetical protein